MTTLLALLALAIGLAASLLSKSSEDPTGHVEGGRAAASIWVIAVGLLLVLIAYIWRGWSSDATHIALGMLVGCFGAILCRWSPSSGRALTGIALAAACGGFLLWIPDDWRLRAQVGAIAGASLASWLLEVRSPSKVSTALYTVVLASAIATDILGAKGMVGTGFNFSGSLLALAAAIAGVLGIVITLKSPKLNWLQIVSVALFAVGVIVIGGRYLGLRDAWLLSLVGVLVGLVTNWLIDDGQDALRPLIAAVLWIGLATIGFALRRGYGMSLCLVGGVSTLILLGNIRALLTLGPLAGLVMYRLFREINVDATRALDIGQHYALIGFATGALLPLMPTEWLRARAVYVGPRLPSSGVIWTVLLVAVPLCLAVLLGAKGVVGFVAGLGMAALIESVRGGYSVQPLSLSVGIAAATTLGYQFLGDNSSMTRDEKMGILAPVAIGLIVLILALLIISPRPTLREAEAL